MSRDAKLFLNSDKQLSLASREQCIILLLGKKILIKSQTTIYDILKKFKLNNKKIAIEHNGTIIPKVSYKKKYLKNNDKLEVVHFIGGG